MKYFYHNGLAYRFSDDWPDEVLLAWQSCPEPSNAPKACVHCGRSDTSLNASGWHCRSCCNSAVRRLDNPGFVRRKPVGYHEPFALQHIDQWRDRFNANVDRHPADDMCHVWVGKSITKGYGVFRIATHNFLAHRLAFLMAGGDFGHEVIMHTCDNPRCVNPSHLRGATHKENMADMSRKGRGGKGSAAHLMDRERHPKSKRVMTPMGEFPSASLAAEAFGVTKATISRRALIGEPGWHYM